MKSAPFALDRPASLGEAARLLTDDPDARLLAGGQSLLPMMHLRLVRPARLVAVPAVVELCGIEATASALTLGAGVTHAAIADGGADDFHGGVLTRIAEGIAYRAVRTRGTIGGSLCHADPAADWLCTLTALGAELMLWSRAGERRVALAGFVVGAFRTTLGAGEIVRAVRIARPSPDARWGYVKACRKPGEFAHAMSAVLLDPARNIRRAVIGAVGGAPVVLSGTDVAPEAVDAALRDSGLDAVARHMQAIILGRALGMAGA